MAGRRSDQDKPAAIDWQTVPIPLGSAGLDLRTPTSPQSLTKLLNARFRDERSIERRQGYIGIELQDADAFALGANTPEGWFYGHGQLLTGLRESHYPLPKQGRGVFKYDNHHVAWTGDRLFVVRDGTSVGASKFWSRGTGATLDRGVPAYIPTQRDSAPPDVVTGDYAETCITEDVRVILASSDNESLIAWVTDRSTGAVLDRADIVGSGSGIYEPRVINSAGIPVALWLNGAELFWSWWGGTVWTTPSPLASSVTTFEVAESPGGFTVVWQTNGVVKIGRFNGYVTDNINYNFGSTLTMPHTVAGAMAFNLAPNGVLGLVSQRASDLTIWASTFAATLASDYHVQLSATVGPWDSGVACCFRGIVDVLGRYNLVIHAGNGALYTQLWELVHGAGVLTVLQTDKRYNTKLASKSFRIGDEVFCWLQAQNSDTNYLVAGVTTPQVSGICDREDALSRVVRATGAPGYGVKGIPMVYVDPDDEYRATWIRPFVTSRIITIDSERSKVEDLYNRAGNCRIGDMNFMPSFSAAQYGESVYIAGSHVRNWDGIELGDAGFSDYPLITFSQTAGAGSLTAGIYQVRAYPVRYNKRGERFQGSAITEAVSISTGGNNTLTVSCKTVPATNHDDVMFEIWRTEVGGTTFYLDGTVANSFAAATVQYTCTISDAVLRLRAGDPHAPGIGIQAEVEEMAPLGCEILAVAGDRLWGAGGQVPPGFVQFSKLKEPGEAAGFDVLNGYQQIDTQGGDVTSLIGYADSQVVAFQRERFYQLFGDGPNNYGVGGFSIPQLRLADGATTHLGTGETQIGVVYWGEDGPRLMQPNGSVANISAQVRELTKAMTPTGVQVDTARQEVVWFTADGTAVVWNYQSNGSRWAQWSGLKVASVCSSALLSRSGVLLTESPDAYGDNGAPFAFAGSSGELNAGAYGGDTEVNSIGIVGAYEGPHELRVRIFYNGSPLWSDQWIWQPTEMSWLISGEELEVMTPAQVDALDITARNGSYATHKKVNRHTCRHFRVEWSDISSDRPTYRPYELTVEVGAKGGMGRVPINSFRS